MTKWLVCQSCGKPLTTVRVEHGSTTHFTHRSVQCTYCGKLTVLNGDYMSA
jgi:DNA-directed RNA polymerase subunit RPC12/RpoP